MIYYGIAICEPCYNMIMSNFRGHMNSDQLMEMVEEGYASPEHFCEHRYKVPCWCNCTEKEDE